MSHFISTKPFYTLTGVPTPSGFMYSANTIGDEVLCDENYTFTEYNTEDDLAEAVDALVGEDGWYYKCENRIPYPTNPNEWSPADCEP